MCVSDVKFEEFHVTRHWIAVMYHKKYAVLTKWLARRLASSLIICWWTRYFLRDITPLNDCYHENLLNFYIAPLWQVTKTWKNLRSSAPPLSFSKVFSGEWRKNEDFTDFLEIHKMANLTKIVKFKNFPHFVKIAKLWICWKYEKSTVFANWSWFG